MLEGAIWVNMGLLLAIIGFLMRNEHRVTALETRLDLIMSSFNIRPRRSEDYAGWQHSEKD